MARNTAQSSESFDSDNDPVVAVAGDLLNLTLPNQRQFRNRAERAFADGKQAHLEDTLLFDPATFPERKRDQKLDMFLDTCAPSKVKRSHGIGNIRVLSPSYEVEGLGDVDKVEADWKTLQESGQTINFEAIKTLAVSNGCLGGSWLLFFITAADVDAAWEKIARATVKDELGTHAKVTPCEDVGEGKDLHGSKHVVCVYTKDFTDMNNIRKIEGALRELGFKNTIKFKPRVYGSIGVYGGRGMEWGLPPTIYVSEWDDSRGVGRIKECGNRK